VLDIELRRDHKFVDSLLVHVLAPPVDDGISE
jgi:hypothetical protein